MKIVTFPVSQIRRHELIAQLRQNRQRFDPETEYIYAHYYSEAWTLRELSGLVAQSATRQRKADSRPVVKSGLR